MLDRLAHPALAHALALQPGDVLMLHLSVVRADGAEIPLCSSPLAAPCGTFSSEGLAAAALPSRGRGQP